MALSDPLHQPSFDQGVRQFGMEPEAIRSAISNGNVERKRAMTRHHAPTAQGFYGWNGVLSKLSENAEELGWMRRNHMCLPVLLHPQKKTLLFVCSGDEYTGRAGFNIMPRSRNPKGSLVRALTEQNKRLNQTESLPLEIQEPENAAILAELGNYTSYVLLVHFSKRDCEIRYEISQADSMNSQGYLSPNGVRLIAPPYGLEADEFDDEDPNDGFDGPGDFEVKLKD